MSQQNAPHRSRSKCWNTGRDTPRISHVANRPIVLGRKVEPGLIEKKYGSKSQV